MDEKKIVVEEMDLAWFAAIRIVPDVSTPRFFEGIG
jgi:hypothetical protein